MSKYSSLPDIDTGADVFETPDVPAEHSYQRDSDSDDDYHLPRAGSPTATRRQLGQAQQGTQAGENLDGDRLDAAEARRRFGAASMAAASRESRAPSSSRPTRRTLPSASVYTTDPDPEERAKETPLERLRRLRLEMAELEDEVRRSEAERATAEPEKEGEGELPVPTSAGQDKKGKKREVSPAVILQQLQLLRGDLSGLEPAVEGMLEADGEKEPGAAEEEEGQLVQKAKASSGLLAKLGLGGSSSTAAPAATAGGAKEAPKPAAGLGEAKEGELEKRLAELEKVVGASEADIDETHPLPPPLVSTLSRLDHLLTLLTQPRHLDSISRRVKVLVSDLERIHESRRKLGDSRPLNVALSGGLTLVTGSDAQGKPTPLASLGASTTGSSSASAAQLPPDALQKIDALFALLPRLDPLLPLAPRLLTRLQSLSSLHASAASFGETLSELKDEVERMGEGEKGLREVLEGLESSLQENEGTVKGNLEALGKRVEEVGRRLDKLGAQ
ncbi:hypothetical protein JCM8097_004185 [Rhodosporidiobolus ruineniae]